MDVSIIILGVPNVFSVSVFGSSSSRHWHCHYIDWQGVGVTWLFCLATDNTNHYSIDNLRLRTLYLFVLCFSFSTCTAQRPVRYSEPVAHAHCVLRDF